MDFQILALAYAFKEELTISDGQDFNSFFICFEQLMAYTRFEKNQEDTFNGVSRVRRMMNDKPKVVKIGLSHQLLSNQKAYGIWGKYNRPFREMKFKENKDLINLYIKRIDKFPDLKKRVKSIWKKRGNKTSHVNTEKIKSWIKILDNPSDRLNEILVDLILNDKQNNELKIIFDNHWEELNDLSGYDFFMRLKELSDNQNFKQYISQIINTEKTISPLNHIFHYLQKKSYWTEAEIKSDKQIDEWKKKLWKNFQVDQTGFSPDLIKLSNLLKSDNIQLVRGLVKRNEEVTAQRNAAPWLSYIDNNLSIDHFQGASEREYDPSRDTNFSYFFNCYISLYNQLKVN